MPELLIEHPETGDAYYTGPLVPALVLVEQDRFIARHELDGGRWLVELCDDTELESAAEWGSGATLEEATRYALGAAFGPIDDVYDEAQLAHLLAGVKAPLDVWLRFDDPEDEEASHEANTFITEALSFRVEWCHTAVGQISSQEFGTYEAAAKWLTEAGYQDFSS